MEFIDKLNRLVKLYIDSIKLSIKPGIWWPFFAYLIVQFLILLVVRNYTNPYLYPALKPIANLFGEQRAEALSHYPSIFLLMPYIFQMGKIALGVIFEGLAIGLTAVLFLKAFSPSKFKHMEISFALKRWLSLLLAWSIITGILVILNFYVPPLFDRFLVGSPKRIMAFEIALKLVTVLLYTPFIYAVPSIIVYKNSLLKAFKTSLRLFIQYPVFSFFLAFLAYFVSAVASWPAGEADVIISKFAPDLVFYLLALGLIVDFAVNVIFTGARVKFLLEETG